MGNVSSGESSRGETALSVAATLAVAGLVGLRLIQRMKDKSQTERQPLSADEVSSLQASHERASKLLAFAATLGYTDSTDNPRVGMWFSPSLGRMVTVNDLVVGRRGENYRHVILQPCRKQAGTYYVASPITNVGQQPPPEQRPRLEISWGVMDGEVEATSFTARDLTIADALSTVSEALDAGDLESVDFTVSNRVWEFQD